MRSFIDRITATDADRRLVEHWSDYAMEHYGADAARQLRMSLDGDAKVKSRRALRMAIRHVERRLQSRIYIAAGPR